MCRSAHNDIRGAHTNSTPELLITVTLAATLGRAQSRHEVGRDNPAIHTSVLDS